MKWTILNVIVILGLAFVILVVITVWGGQQGWIDESNYDLILLLIKGIGIAIAVGMVWVMVDSIRTVTRS